ncbi:hypothetical protein C8Q79DRAFT_989785 [Trametes meyenii]|nr:hypothetical protein C8Q79DRAFT_989785 [Trametes meyenii]
MPTISFNRPRSASVLPSNRLSSGPQTSTYIIYTTTPHPRYPTPPSHLLTAPWRRDELSMSTTSSTITTESTSTPILQPSTTFAAQIAGIPPSSSSSGAASKPVAIALCVVFGVLVLAGIGGVVYLKRRIRLRASRASRILHGESRTLTSSVDRGVADQVDARTDNTAPAAAGIGSDNLAHEKRRHKTSAARDLSSSHYAVSDCGLDTDVAVEDEQHTDAYTDPKPPVSFAVPAPPPHAAIVCKRERAEC